MEPRLKMIIKSLGYRAMEDGNPKWGKPAGYTIFIFEEVGEGIYKVSGWFKGADAKLHPWSSYTVDITLPDEKLRMAIAYAEAAVTRVSWEPADFSFLSPLEQLEN